MQHPAKEVFHVGLLRTSHQALADFLLQACHKIRIALAGDYCQDVGIMNSGRIIHAVSLLIDAQAQPSSYFLTPGNGIVAVLEHAHHKDIGIIPAFPQGRVRKDETHRLRQGQKTFLVLEDQVVGVHIIGQAFVFTPLADSGIDHAFFLVDGK